MIRGLLHAFVNVERGPLVFAWALLTRPGGIARGYIGGRRRRYYGPFALLNLNPAPTFWQTSAFWAAWYAYFGWAASQFYAGARWRSWLRGMLVAAIGHALIIRILAAGSAVYETMSKA